MNSQVNQSSGVFSTTVTRVTAGSDSEAIVEAVVVFEWIQAEIRAMCVVLDAVTGALWLNAVWQRAPRVE
jgi:hypothetical protein